MSIRVVLLFLTCLPLALASGCATRFPAGGGNWQFADGLDARDILDRSLQAHGGDMAGYPGDFNLASDGHWYRLIQRIQPVVTDSGYRIRSEERYSPRLQVYAVRHEGPDGTKQVIRRPGSIEVFYNGQRETDPVKLRATAMTADAFQMFHFGPSFIHWRATDLERLPDSKEHGRRYLRLLAQLKPGFGEAEQDQVVLWIAADDYRLYRVHQTLTGFETTQGAHVDTTFCEYRWIGGFLLPVQFHERVRGPIRVAAHRWWITGMDVDRGWSPEDVATADFLGRAAAPVAPFSDSVEPAFGSGACGR